MENKYSRKFQEIYNKLDQHLRKQLEIDDYVSHIHVIKLASEKYSIINSVKDELIQFAQLRNAIVHNPDRKDAHPIAEPHQLIVDKYQIVLNQVLNPKKVSSIAVLKKDIYSTSLDDISINVMKMMNRKAYTHAPVLENDKVIGVFSENVVFSYLVKNEIAGADEKVKIEEFSEFLPLDSHPSEFFKFISMGTLVLDVKKLFEEELNKNKRLGAVFLTNNGRESGKLMGLLTAWDLAGI